MGKTYNSLEDFDSKTSNAIEQLIYSDETFIVGIQAYASIFTTWWRWWYDRFSEKLILTDQRILMFKRGWIRESSEDYTLDEITSISFDKGMFSAKMKIQGAGISDSFRLPAEEGRDFQKAVREQKNRLEDGKEPLDVSSDSGYESASSGPPSKYGSVKNHVIIALLTVWWTAGLGNIAYLAYCFYQYDE